MFFSAFASALQARGLNPICEPHTPNRITWNSPDGAGVLWVIHNPESFCCKIELTLSGPFDAIDMYSVFVDLDDLPACVPPLIAFLLPARASRGPIYTLPWPKSAETVPGGPR